MPKTSVQKRVNRDSDGNIVSTQYVVTIPKGIAEGLGLDEGSKSLDWKIKSGSSLAAQVIDEDSDQS